MYRKQKLQDVSREQRIERHSPKVESRESVGKEDIEVNLLMGAQRSPLSIRVPYGCNMKILKSILWFHLKKILTLSQYNTFLGFQCSPPDYQLDYQLQNGLGGLCKPVNLTPFIRNSKYSPDSLLCYKICKLVSQGGFSKVYLLRSYQSGQFLVGKFMQKHKSDHQLIANEFQIAKNLEHTFLIKSHYLIDTQSFFVIVMEYASGGQLFQLLKQIPKMGQEQGRFYVVETLLALKYLHQRGIIYRDIKPENIMLDQYGHVKLIDFGLAKNIRDRTFSFCGSFDYMAPQVIEENQGYSFEVDYYSVGNLMYELLTGAPPFYHSKQTTEQLKQHILHTPVPLPKKGNLSVNSLSLLKKLLQKDPALRLGHKGGIDEILNHKWFRQVDIEEIQHKNIDPPFNIPICSKNAGEIGSESELREWQGKIERDLKQMKIKAIYQRKNTHGKRHQSIDEYQYPATTTTSPVKQLKNLKLKSNMSLLNVLFHKRSASDFQNKERDQPISHPSSLLNLKSENLSRKSSIHGQNKIRNRKTGHVLVGKEGSKSHLRNNFLQNYSIKSKQNVGIRKKVRDGIQRPYFKS